MENRSTEDGPLHDFTNSAESTPMDDFYVVALGASAGGLESLEVFFKSVPSNSGLAFIVLQHLSPDFRSLMDELLARHTTMSIVKAHDDMSVEPNTIYLNPPRKTMVISGGSLFLSDVDPGESPTLPIDQFFRSLAQDCQQRAIAVVLSGTGSDGSRGIRDVHEAGGFVLAETEETAKFDGMPRSAHDTGCVHLVLPPKNIPDALLKYTNQTLDPQEFAEQDYFPPDLGAMETVFRMLRKEYSLDFSHYKPNTVVRRIERRVALQHSGSIEEYVAHLRADHEELNALYRDLLIGVTRFFRDRDAFEFLRTESIPRLIHSKKDGDDLRIWIAGCATGEEAYSIAILVDEVLQAAKRDLDVKIFATDVHQVSLDFASAGGYPEESFEHFDAGRLSQYFEETVQGYQVRDSVRKMIVFARHNVFKDAPFTKLDLVSCRNLLIYLQPLAQKKALSLFHFGLRTSGVLLLGPSETPGELKEEFETQNNRWKIYSKKRDIRLPADIRMPLGSEIEDGPGQHKTQSTRPPVSQRNLLIAYDRLLDEHIGGAFLIDDSRTLLHVFGNAKEYLEPRAGRVSTDLLEMVRVELKATLASAIQRLRTSAKPINALVPLGKDGDTTGEVEVSVDKLVDFDSQQQWFIVTIGAKAKKTAAQVDTKRLIPADYPLDRVADLETELRYAKESLQTTVEELETSNEELQATNEELVASNEELQSTNEELQSVNEELYTVNAEYQNKIAELTELTADMDNLLESTEIGTIFLDRQLAIRKFTGKVGQWFDLVTRDLGRKIATFANSLNHAGLMEDVELVLSANKSLEREIRDKSGRWLHLRLHPYRIDGAASGVVMTLIDISNLRKTKAKLHRLSAIVESSDDGIIGKSFSGQIESWNPAAERLFGYSASEAVGQDISLILPEDFNDEARQFLDQIRRGESVPPIETTRRAKDGSILDIAVRFSPIREDETGEVTGISAICRDISHQKRAEREVEKLALVARHTDNAVVITNAEGETEWVNEGFTRITGYQLNEVKGRKPGHLLQGPESNPDVVQIMRDRIAAGREFNVEIINYRKDGRPYWLAIEAQPLRNEAGDVTAFMAIQRDVSALKSAQDKAEAEVARRDEFLAMLSHELRNPLGAIKAGLEVLQQDEQSSQNDSLKNVLREQVAQMSRLLDDLLDVSRVNQDKILIQMEVMDLRVATARAVASVEPVASRYGCTIKMRMPDHPVIIQGDAARLQQVHVNLLTNAIKNSHQGQVVALTMTIDGEFAKTTVTDSGVGIPPELHAKIFDLFFQTDVELSRSDGGLGVGLALVKDFVTKHNGSIYVESDGNERGTEFTVRLPLCSSAQLERETLAEPISSSTSLRIVVVEDHMANRQMIKQLLESYGHIVWDVATGGEALKLISEKQPDLALVDIGLPDITGYQVVEQLKQNGLAKNTHITALTGYGRAVDVQHALSAGFDAHLVKPVDLKELDAIISAISSDLAD